MIRLIAPEVEQKVHGEQRLELGGLVDDFDILLCKFEAQGVGHSFDMLDGLDAHDWGDVS